MGSALLAAAVRALPDKGDPNFSKGTMKLLKRKRKKNLKKKRKKSKIKINKNCDNGINGKLIER